MDFLIGGRVGFGMGHSVDRETNVATNASFLVGPQIGEDEWSVALSSGIGFQVVTQPVVEPFLSVPLQLHGKFYGLSQISSDNIGLVVQADYGPRTGEINGGVVGFTIGTSSSVDAYDLGVGYLINRIDLGPNKGHSLFHGAFISLQISGRVL